MVCVNIFTIEDATIWSPPKPTCHLSVNHHHTTGDAPTTTFNPFTPPEKNAICNLFTPTETTTICKPYTPPETTTTSNPFTHSFILHCLCTRHRNSSWYMLSFMLFVQLL
ncbi:hypothetical protein Hanom_Chr12g01072891 [Helianthus anomalus]